LVLDISIDGADSRAYACDNQGIEMWLRGRTVDGIVNLANTDGTRRLDGQVTAAAVSGTLSIGDTQWSFRADPVGGTDA
jgi:hypothetical protein